MATGTRLSWDGGLAFATDGSADFEPAVVTPPAAVAERIVVAEVIDSVTVSGTEVFPVTRQADKPYARHRIVIGGKDVTWFRDVETPMPTYGLVSPLLYGSGSVTFPQIHAAYERPGVGALAWLKKFASVKIQRVDAANNVVATDWRGFVADFQHSGRELACTLGGEATGRAAMMDRPVPIFARVSDIGNQAILTVQHHLRLPTGGTPNTGIAIAEAGGGSELDFLTETMAKSTQRDGIQWTIMPNSNGVYRMFQKDVTTIDATAYIDGFHVVEALRRDFTEEPNRVWASAIAPDGRRIRFAIYPGLTSGARPAFPGTLNAGDSGAGVTALIWRLWTVGYIDGNYPPSAWTTDSGDPVTRAVADLQDDAGLVDNAVVNNDTWNAAFDVDVTGYSLRRSAIKPAAQWPYTQAFLRTASGQVRKPNPKYDRSKPFVDITVDMGAGWEQRQVQKWAKRELANGTQSNWVGTITLTTGALVDGTHNPAGALTSSNVRDARSMKPGMNLWLPNWDGGVLVHVSGANVQDGSVELTVDTRARDTMKVWEVIARNRESRKNPARQWIAQNRRSGQRDDTGAFYDGSVFGKLPRTFCPANTWTILKTPGGRSGTLNKITLTTDTAQALFVFGIFGKQVSATRMDNVIGNPLTLVGTKNWASKQKTLTDDMWMVYAAGGVTDGVRQFCGFWPETVDPNAFRGVHKTGTATASTDVITITGHGYSNGTEVYFSDGSVPEGLTGNNNYFVIAATTNTFEVSASPGGGPMNITADATGVDVSTRTQAYPPVTGEFRDPAGVPYFCKGAPVLWIPFYPDRDCFVQGGRALDLLLDDSAG